MYVVALRFCGYWRLNRSKGITGPNGQDALTNNPTGEADIDSDCESSHTGAGEGTSNLGQDYEGEKAGEAHTVLTSGSVTT